jgi:ATP-dependent Lon protease
MRHVLIADDDVNVREILSALFRSRGYAADLVANGIDAVREFACRPYELVVTDYRMPGMDGIEVAEAVRRLDPDARIVFMTADPLFASLRERIDMLAVERTIQKPFRIAEILDLENILVPETADRQ